MGERFNENIESIIVLIVLDRIVNAYKLDKRVNSFFEVLLFFLVV